ncbi:MAG TPA: lysine--tRNA ligase [Anaerolineae bacterium]|nr:lysine--tRNA ligase [Anaerolineae bacterium]HIQ05469.1 lysine--tRNA ligase [Anaerolineae bacterium]
MSEQLTDQEIFRRQKLGILRERGIEPYPRRVRRTHTAVEAVAALEAFEADEEAGEPPVVTVVGRLVSQRIMGRVSFAHIEDGSGRIQLFVKRDLLGSERYNEFFKKLLDLGDFVGATGRLVRTRTGEPSVEVTEIELLSKALHPLPDKWHGLRDVEARYRMRYVDLMVNPEVRQIFITRAKIVSALRRYLDSQGFIEVETPILQPIYGGAAARPFTTFHNQLQQELYLRISFELYLKRLLVGGYERVYEIGRDFRNEGVSYKHNPEFTQLEFYEAYTDYLGVMERVEEMITYVAQEVAGGLQITYQGQVIDLTPPWRRVTMRDVILETTGIDYKAHPTTDSLAEAMRAIGHEPDPRSNRGKLIDSLFSTHVEPTLIQPTFVMDYPIEISPLAKKKADDPTTVERFEYFIGGLELGNAFTELNDPIDQRERFEAMQRMYAAGDEERHPVDEDYLLAMRYGMPPNGGFGTGVDRLVMLFTDQASIREVILFPHLRSKE